MKKFILPIMTLVVTVVAFSSCSKNDDYCKPSSAAGQICSTKTYSDNQLSSSVPVKADYHGKCFFVSDNMAKAGSFTVKVTDGKQNSEYNIVSQGKHGTYEMGANGKVYHVTGYYLEVVMPTKQDLKSTVTFTPNEAAQNLGDPEKVEASFFSAAGSGNSSSLKFNHSGLIYQDFDSSHIVELCQAAADWMTD